MTTDLEIQKNVMDELKWSPLLNASEIGVAVKSGVVTLSGTVDMYYKKTTAENAAKRVSGVKAVAEDIEVRPVAGLFKNDSELAEAILKALKWHSAVEEERVKIKVDEGVVSLDGEVDWNYQKSAIHAAVESLVGVKRIINNISIKPRLVIHDLKEKVSSAFLRNATLDADKININVSGNRVVLSGKVRSWAEKKDAENAVWSAPGVITVQNELIIDPPVYAL